MGRFAYLTSLVALLAAAVALSQGPVSAHAILTSSVPKDGAVLQSAPKRIVLRFSTRIEKGVSSALLTRADGRRVNLKRPAKGFQSGPANHLVIPLPALRAGDYRLKYEILAADGHTTLGLLRFTIRGRRQ